MRHTRNCVLLFSLLSSQFGFSQSSSILGFQQRINAAFSGNSSPFPSSVRLSGNAVWTAGSLQDSGGLNLQLSSDGSTAETWNLSTLPHSSVQGPIDLVTFARSCVFTDASGQQQSDGGPNCMQGMPWFFAPFILQPAYASLLAVTDQTSSDDISQGLTRLTYSLSLTSTTAATPLAAQPQKDMTFTILYTTQTALPASLVYQQTSDSDQSQAIETIIQYSAYSPESGFMLPHHLQRYLQRTLNADITITSATVN